MFCHPEWPIYHRYCANLTGLQNKSGVVAARKRTNFVIFYSTNTLQTKTPFLDSYSPREDWTSTSCRFLKITLKETGSSFRCWKWANLHFSAGSMSSSVWPKTNPAGKESVKSLWQTSLHRFNLATQNKPLIAYRTYPRPHSPVSCAA